eukprot:8090202-Pyramimonas_sp.AAC.1
MANVSKADLAKKLAQMYKVHDHNCIQLFGFKDSSRVSLQRAHVAGPRGHGQFLRQCLHHGGLINQFARSAGSYCTIVD